MTDAAGFKIVGRSGDTSLMSFLLCFCELVALMTGNAIHRKMELLADHSFIDQITFVVFFRPDRGRSASSPLGLAAYFGRLDERFHFIRIGVAGNTASSVGSCRQNTVRFNILPVLMAFCTIVPGKLFFPVVTVKAIFLRLMRFQGNLG